MSRLLLFNPEHDYALANGGPYYIPPATVVKLALQLQFIPLLWGEPGDYILLQNDSVVRISEDTSVYEVNEFDGIKCVEPWGWDMAVRHRLLKIGLEEQILPGETSIENVRRLSHRRISIAFNKFLDSPLIPEEFFEVEKAEDFALNNPGCYFKLPWSSGGRGVLATKELSHPQKKEWIAGGIKKQRSILGERFIDRNLDFATLWTTTESDVIFEGVSISLSDGRGKYKGNLYGPQEKLFRFIRNQTSEISMSVIESQKSFITSRIAPFYHGKLGIDMIVDKRRILYPCVEVNLRRTMGHVAIDFFNFANEGRHFPTPLPLIDINNYRN